MLFLRKLLKLPTPVDLGWSEYNALESRDFTPDCKGPTWEDWHVEVKKLHPVKYFIAETFGNFLRYKIWLRGTRPLKDAHYWLVSHLIPSRRYHMLDLRQPCGKKDAKNIDCYRYGWHDVPEKMLFAMFNLLKEYLKEEPYDLTSGYSLEEINNDPCLKSQHESLLEARAILYWWEVERKEGYTRYYELLHQWSELRENEITRKNGEADEAFQELHDHEEQLEKTTDDMIVRLMKIRRGLWT